MSALLGWLRSIKYTWESIKDNIIDELRKNHEVDIAVFNNNVEDTLVDGIRLNNDDMSIIPYNSIFEYKQTVIDSLISKIPGYERDFKYFFGELKQNGMRLMYVEGEVAKFLAKRRDDYDYVVVSNADYLYTDKLPLTALESVMEGTIGTCSHLDSRGYTDGLYIGHIDDIAKILSRIDYYQRMLDTFDGECSENTGGHGMNYESFVKLAFELNNIERMKIGFSFVKIRGNGNICGMRSDGTTHPMWVPAIEQCRRFLSDNKESSENYKFLYNHFNW